MFSLSANTKSNVHSEQADRIPHLPFAIVCTDCWTLSAYIQVTSDEQFDVYPNLIWCQVAQSRMGPLADPYVIRRVSDMPRHSAPCSRSGVTCALINDYYQATRSIFAVYTPCFCTIVFVQLCDWRWFQLCSSLAYCIIAWDCNGRLMEFGIVGEYKVILRDWCRGGI
jgi:hypothetical protein